MAHRLTDDRPNLWEFSLQHYSRPGVADACLRLQDEHGVNVNLLLWCAWLEQLGIILDSVRLRNAQERIQAWDENYVVPLRQLRRRMKTEFGVSDSDIEQVRKQIKQAELLAEKQLQSWLEALVTTYCGSEIYPAYSQGDNVRFYLQQHNISTADIKNLLCLFGQAYT